jgi:hypothetical protein
VMEAGKEGLHRQLKQRLLGCKPLEIITAQGQYSRYPCFILVFLFWEVYYLFLSPDLNPGEAALEPEPPLVGAVVHPAQVRHDGVEGPHVHKVEQLREQLDRQGRVHTALPADQFKNRVVSREHFAKLQF